MRRHCPALIACAYLSEQKIQLAKWTVPVYCQTEYSNLPARGFTDCRGAVDAITTRHDNAHLEK